MNAASETRWIESTDGVRVPLRRIPTKDPSGNTASPLLLVAHATGFCGALYRPLVERLSGVEAFEADLRGHGQARGPSDLDYRWQSFADDLEAVVDTLRSEDDGDRPLYGFGHSMGAACLLMIEARRPGAFAGLVCYEPVVHPPEAAEAAVGGASSGRLAPMIERTRNRRSAFASRDAAREHFAGKLPFSRFHPAILDAYVEHGFAPEEEGRVRLRCRPEIEARIYAMGPRHQTWERLATIACPVLVARGSEIQPGPSSWADRIAAELPKGELAVVEGLGHLGPFEDPVRVADRLQRFLAANREDC